ncbi:TetR/AcrR family transcriptional regulator [Vibrio sp. CyArs1]|uniref:TetR/AcrR family transcriptional regulator n=1 Tax=Vibrio sp. CyArs1 TaxID=2682577 RepID=UPI001F06C2DE|nr:TetR/AcrR family transcriptional regulator [Vibrio sp. CyArs1]
MPLSKQHKQESRDRILNSAILLFFQFGYEKVSIDNVMKKAGLTRGAFYAHFSSKAVLYHQSLTFAAKSTHLASGKPAHLSNKDWLYQLVGMYLSLEHLKLETPPCPIAFMALEAKAHEKQVRDAYTLAYQNMKEALLTLTDQGICKEAEILPLIALMVGSVCISKTLTNKNEQMKLLANSKDAAFSILDSRIFNKDT